MATLISPITNTLWYENNKMDKYFSMENITLRYFINKEKLNLIMKNILVDFCGASVIGYDRTYDKYFCKICKNNKCELYVEIKIYYEEDDISQISVIPIIGNKYNIKKIVLDFDEALKLYKSSSFIKSCLEEQFL
jgi:hypothetical protein